MNWKDLEVKIAEMIQNNNMAPWKAEQVALKEGVPFPDHLARGEEPEPLGDVDRRPLRLGAGGQRLIGRHPVTH